MSRAAKPTMMLIDIDGKAGIALPWADGEVVLPLLRGALFGTITGRTNGELGLLSFDRATLSIGAAGFDNVRAAHGGDHTAKLAVIRNPAPAVAPAAAGATP